MSHRSEMIQLLASFDKAVTVLAFNGPLKLHIRRYYGESDKTFLICYGTTRLKQEFLDILSLGSIIVTEFESLEIKKPDYVVGGKTAELATIVVDVKVQKKDYHQSALDMSIVAQISSAVTLSILHIIMPVRC
ncbi:hypothetical protein BsWGS_13904 [Bradybaena similaris]